MATWVITIPELGVYEQREGCFKKVQGVALLTAALNHCRPCIDTPWKATEDYSYEKPLRLPEVLIPEKARHGPLAWLLCALGYSCRWCDDHTEMLRIPGEDSAGNGMALALPVRIPGRRTLIARNKAGEFGVVRVALFYDLMLGLPPDPGEVNAWVSARADAMVAPESA